MASTVLRRSIVARVLLGEGGELRPPSGAPGERWALGLRPQRRTAVVLRADEPRGPADVQQVLAQPRDVDLQPVAAGGEDGGFLELTLVDLGRVGALV